MMGEHIKKSKNEEAQKMLNIFRFYQRDGSLYLIEDEETLDALFDAIVFAINDSGIFKTMLPYIEFVYPCKRVYEGDAGWIGHFDERDNRRFFLSDLYDFLKLFYD
jgi:hypothetical protein